MPRLLVLLADGTAPAETARVLRSASGLRVASSADFSGGAVSAADLAGADALLLDRLGVLLVDGDALPGGGGDASESAKERRARFERVAGMPVLAVEDEREVRAYDTRPVFFSDDAERRASEVRVTWGLHAIGADRSVYTGRGVSVAVLDTGLDAEHPDVAGRDYWAHAFVAGVAGVDNHGHGTHCAGTVGGPLEPVEGPRYGVAPNAKIYSGKVLREDGGGGDGGILAGVNWALSQGCRVVSMSLGAETKPGELPSRVFETAARRAMKQGTLLVAAAGNESRRNAGHVAPVGHPANCPSVLAVGAVDGNLAVADFSNGSVGGGSAGHIDLVAPGVDVYSSYPMPVRTTRLGGTSMACPHVAGIAALLLEENAETTADGLWSLLVRTAKRLDAPSVDVGAGLVQAP